MARLGTWLPARLRTPLALLALALMATFPLVLSLPTRLVGHEDVDVWNHAWGAWWFWRALGTGSLPYHTALLAAPDGGVLWYIDPIGALLGAPLVGLVGVVATYNLVILLEVALSAAAGRALAKACGATDRAAWIAAIGLAFSPYLLSEIHNGVSEAAGVPWPVFALAAGRRAIDRGGAGRWALAGFWLGITGIGTWYYGLGAGLTLLTWVVFAPRARRKASWLGLVVCGVIAAALAGPPLALARETLSAPDALVVRGELQGADRELLLTHNAVDPRAYVAPLGFQSVDLAARGEAFRHSSYVGLLLLALACWGRPGLLLGVVPALALSFGPWLWWGGDWVTVSGARLALPFSWLQGLLPSSAATHAQRVGYPVIAVVAALAAVGASRLPRRWLAPLGGFVALDLLSSSPWPLARTPALDTTTHAALRVGLQHESGVVLDLPAEVDATMATSRYLVYQSASGQPIPYRPDARAGTSSLLGVAAFQVLALPSLYRPEHREPLSNMVAGMADVDLRVFGQKVRWVVVHRELERGDQGVARIEAQLQDWFGTPQVEGTHAVWDTRTARGTRGNILRTP